MNNTGSRSPCFFGRCLTWRPRTVSHSRAVRPSICSFVICRAFPWISISPICRLPRDLFDVMELLAHEGIDADLRCAFIVYLFSHNRPMAEVLNPTLKDISDEFIRGFSGMADNLVSLDDLVTAREALIANVVGQMSDEHRQFLLSFERDTPDWPLLGLSGIDELPAVRWRRQNLDRIDPAERAELVERLETVLFP